MAEEELIEQSNGNNLSPIEEEQPEPLVIETKGKWQPFEAMINQSFEVGKTYKINIQGLCQFAISKEKPTSGFGANGITYTKNNDNTLWIKTGE